MPKAPGRGLMATRIWTPQLAFSLPEVKGRGLPDSRALSMLPDIPLIRDSTTLPQLKGGAPGLPLML